MRGFDTRGKVPQLCRRLRACWGLALLSLSSCGLSDAPTPEAQVSAGTLLLAPLQVSLGTQRLSLSAAPVVTGKCSVAAESCHLVVVAKLNVSASKAVTSKVATSKTGSSARPVSPLSVNVQSLYLVTDGGVWAAEVRDQDVQRSAAQLTVRLSAQAALRPGQATQAVVGFTDPSGHQHLLRARSVSVAGKSL